VAASAKAKTEMARGVKRRRQRNRNIGGENGGIEMWRSAGGVKISAESGINKA
jgi:hypothetical protein